jgi:hypothetical protein
MEPEVLGISQNRKIVSLRRKRIVNATAVLAENAESGPAGITVIFRAERRPLRRQGKMATRDLPELE